MTRGVKELAVECQVGNVQRTELIDNEAHGQLMGLVRHTNDWTGHTKKTIEGFMPTRISKIDDTQDSFTNYNSPSMQI